MVQVWKQKLHCYVIISIKMCRTKWCNVGIAVKYSNVVQIRFCTPIHVGSVRHKHYSILCGVYTCRFDNLVPNGNLYKVFLCFETIF